MICCSFGMNARGRLCLFIVLGKKLVPVDVKQHFLQRYKPIVLLSAATL